MKIEDIIDRNTLRERLNGDFKLFSELAGLFIKESPTLLNEVEMAVLVKNGKSIGKAAHKIKGAISNFSANSAYTAAANLEKFGKNDELDLVGTAFEALKTEVGQLNQALVMLMAEDHL